MGQARRPWWVSQSPGWPGVLVGATGGGCRRDHPGGARGMADVVPEPGRRPHVQGRRVVSVRRASRNGSGLTLHFPLEKQPHSQHWLRGF